MLIFRTSNFKSINPVLSTSTAILLIWNISNCIQFSTWNVPNWLSLNCLTLFNIQMEVFNILIKNSRISKLEKYSKHIHCKFVTFRIKQLKIERLKTIIIKNFENGQIQINCTNQTLYNFVANVFFFLTNIF